MHDYSLYINYDLRGNTLGNLTPVVLHLSLKSSFFKWNFIVIINLQKF